MRITEDDFLDLENRDTSKYQIYRIDRAYEDIYVYDKDRGAYKYMYNFLMIDAERKNRDKTILKKIDEYEEYRSRIEHEEEMREMGLLWGRE